MSDVLSTLLTDKPVAGRAVAVSLTKAPDPADDRIGLVVEVPGRDGPHRHQTYDVYRNGPGWQPMAETMQGRTAGHIRALVRWWQTYADRAEVWQYRILSVAHALPGRTAGQLVSACTGGSADTYGQRPARAALDSAVAGGLLTATPAGAHHVTAAGLDRLSPGRPHALGLAEFRAWVRAAPADGVARTAAAFPGPPGRGVAPTDAGRAEASASPAARSRHRGRGDRTGARR